MSANHSQRCRQVASALRQRGLDCLIVTHPANWFYLTGFTGESGALVVERGAATLVTDGRFTVQAREEARGIRVVLQKGGLFAALGEWLRQRGLRRIGFDPFQLSLGQWNAVRKAAGAKCRTIEVEGIPEGLRTRKDAQELAQMRKAAVVVGEVFESVLPLVRPGVRESELAAELEYQMRRRGASGPSFETIVASGKRSALPHARPTARQLRKNELVVLDLGVILGHYCSDMTRTVYLGRAPRRIRGWYEAVREAQAAGVAAVEAGITCGEVDSTVREVLKTAGLEEHFVHSTGHGLGLEVHEEPRVARGQQVRLQAGNVITIEPGVYVEGVGGIRIEDDVVVRATGNEVLTRVKRDLIEI
ncbi:MAG: Xaa-Pro peptidase family protein [Candidatus Acidiferrum sp.]